MNRALDARLGGPGSYSRPFHFYMTTMGKLFTRTYASLTNQYIFYADQKTAMLYVGPVESILAAIYQLIIDQSPVGRLPSSRD